jgi:hypothetical protein
MQEIRQNCGPRPRMGEPQVQRYEPARRANKNPGEGEPQQVQRYEPARRANKNPGEGEPQVQRYEPARRANKNPGEGFSPGFLLFRG